MDLLFCYSERGDDSSWRRDDGYRDSRGPPRGRDYRDGPPQSRQVEVLTLLFFDSLVDHVSVCRGRDYDQYDSPRGSRRGPPRDYDDRGSPRDRDDRGPPRDHDRDERGPPRDRDRDERGPPREHDHAERGPPRDHDRDERGPPRERDRDERGPPRDRDDRGPPRDHGDDWRRRPDQRERDDTRGERRGAYRPPGARDRGKIDQIQKTLCNICNCNPCPLSQAMVKVAGGGMMAIEILVVHPEEGIIEMVLPAGKLKWFH